MLKCLELVGFKSFADKTRFEFDAGITAIVGPNGSGKSNVVDAIRWILGEQSAKSLRGKEMADVIFNGSATRRPQGIAEVSLTLVNHHRFLPIESNEVVLTRRVYRSGEGEYLINGQVARLRDIKDLFVGTGAGLGAYSIIEQGKVDLMLQASTKDRRYIFEEAAGISRFRGRKVECLRRLERVRQQLLRVRDIQEELDKQIRGLRTQAGKARRHQEYSDRLRGLRLDVGRHDVRGFAQSLSSLDQRADESRRELVEIARQQVEARERQQVIDAERRRIDESLRLLSAAVARGRERLLTLQGEQTADDRRAEELAREIAVARTAASELARRRSRLETQRAEISQRRRLARQEQASAADSLEQLSRTLRERLGEIESLEALSRSARDATQERLRELARRENEQAGLESQLALHWQQLQRANDRHQALRHQLHSLHRDLSDALAIEASVRVQASHYRSQASSLQEAHRTLLAQRAELVEQLARSRDQRTAIVSRIEVLENLRQRHEGVQGGVRQALARRDRGEAPWTSILGVLVETINVDARDADLVELALGSRAQSLMVATEADLTDELIESARTLPGRIQFLALDGPDVDRLVVLPDPLGASSLASLIDCEPRVRPLIDRLLGGTFLVEQFSAARELAQGGGAPRFVTRTGEIIDVDRSVSAGPARGSAGILSRAAESRELAHQALAVDERIAELEQRLRHQDDRVLELETHLSRNELRESTLSEQARHFEAIFRGRRDRAHARTQEWELALRDIERTGGDIAQVDRALESANASIKELHERIARQHRLAEEAEGRLEQERQRTVALEQEVTRAKIALATADERATSLSNQEQALSADIELREREAAEQRRHLLASEESARLIEQRRLDRGARLAEGFAELDSHADPESLRSTLASLDRERLLIEERAAQLTEQSQREQNELHAVELRRTEFRMQRDTLLNRLREDYEVQLSEDDQEPLAELDLDASRTEIDQLKEKIQRLGAVNLAAVEELRLLEERFQTLTIQLEDLAVAERSIDEVIHKINHESRRLFMETFESVREHFQELFGKLFGGGKADVLLEEGADVLDTGIEIIARPPGKEPRSLSLLSGGEKTLTAVALVMALFRSKPSPFCLLDEVDAALDEANIGRFVGVVREFAAETQFLVITHSKTTMAAADVLHGVTQRESGVSLRVSVRLEDVTEDGHIVGMRDEAP